MSDETSGAGGIAPPAEEAANADKTRTPGKTVYFLGAGFSAAAGIPTIPHFVRESFRLLKRYGPKSLRIAFAEIVARYRHIAASTGIDIDDIQELFSLVSGSHPKTAGSSSKDDSEILRAVIAHTLSLSHLEDKRWAKRIKHTGAESNSMDESLDKDMDRWFERDNRSAEKLLPQRTVPRRHFFEEYKNHPGAANEVEGGKPFGPLLNCCVYEAFFSYVLSRSEIVEEREYKDVIITPNYDLVIEHALANIGRKPHSIDYGANIKHEAGPDGKYLKLKLIKLHGSLNWVPATPDNQWDVKDMLHDVSRLIEEDENSSFLKNFGNLPLIPPTWQRNDERGTEPSGKLFATLRADALEHLQTAERIVIIGYSMPKTDLHIKYLMAHALIPPDYPEIEVWDVKEYSEMKDAVETMFGESLAKEIDYYPKPDLKSGAYKGLSAFVRSRSSLPKKS